MKKCTQSKFIKDDLGNINWAELPGLDDPSCAYRIFIEKCVAIYDWCFPLKRNKAKRFDLRKPWFTTCKGLAKSVKKKNMLYQCFLNNPNSSNEQLKNSTSSTRLPNLDTKNVNLQQRRTETNLAPKRGYASWE